MNDHLQREIESLGHEPIETNVRAVWITGVILAGVVAGAFLVILGLMSWLGANRDTRQAMPAAGEASITDPVWNVPPHVQRLRMREQQLLDTYQWVDQTAGVARIPLDRAMEIIAENGLPEAIGADKGPPVQTTNER
jgi:hypothetical protein